MYERKKLAFSTTAFTVDITLWLKFGVFPLESFRDVGVCTEKKGYNYPLNYFRRITTRMIIDGQADRRTTYYGITALRYRAYASRRNHNDLMQDSICVRKYAFIKCAKMHIYYSVT